MAVTVNGLTGVTFNNGSLQATAPTGTNDQTWQDVLSSRAVGVTYTNATGRPIMVCCQFQPNPAGGPGVILVGGVVAAYGACVQGASEGGVTTMVPVGAQYVFNTSKLLTGWTELR